MKFEKLSWTVVRLRGNDEGGEWRGVGWESREAAHPDGTYLPALRAAYYDCRVALRLPNLRKKPIIPAFAGMTGIGLVWVEKAEAHPD
ncbi:hypothetical protein AGMMS50256_21620 [Betaproteobacteria bacterium]|nr:hypothetical protein AGMMS50256_21620 [Betaproteobacteria bacterium]